MNSTAIRKATALILVVTVGFCGVYQPVSGAETPATGGKSGGFPIWTWALGLSAFAVAGGCFFMFVLGSPVMGPLALFFSGAVAGLCTGVAGIGMTEDYLRKRSSAQPPRAKSVTATALQENTTVRSSQAHTETLFRTSGDLQQAYQAYVQATQTGDAEAAQVALARYRALKSR